MLGFTDNAERKRGLTLVEMLTVLFIVSILVSFVTGIARHASRAAETRRAQADLHLLADALERYYLIFGSYPPHDAASMDAMSLLAEVRTLPGGEDYAFRNSLPRTFTALDPWGNSYRYLRQGDETDETETFALYSLGPDKVEKSDDDIIL
jgi:type II secretion system protein G